MEKNEQEFFYQVMEKIKHECSTVLINSDEIMQENIQDIVKKSFKNTINSVMYEYNISDQRLEENMDYLFNDYLRRNLKLTENLKEESYEKIMNDISVISQSCFEEIIEECKNEQNNEKKLEISKYYLKNIPNKSQDVIESVDNKEQKSYRSKTEDSALCEMSYEIRSIINRLDVNEEIKYDIVSYMNRALSTHLVEPLLEYHGNNLKHVKEQLLSKIGECVEKANYEYENMLEEKKIKKMIKMKINFFPNLYLVR